VRVDVFLHRVCIVKSRTLAREACDRGKVLLNGRPTKGSHEVEGGDRLRCDLGLRVLEVEVVEVPPGQVSRKDAHTYYRVLAEERREW
jgi:ribosomal 50S subunit-recycling heat shock protein